MLRYRLSGFAATTVVLLAAVMVLPAAADGQDGTLDPKNAMSANESRLSDYLAWSWDYREKLGQSDGYVAPILNSDANIVTFLWKGSDPVQSDLVAEGERRGITVRFHPRLYSASEIESASRKIWEASDLLADSKFHLTAVVGVRESIDDSRLLLEGVAVDGSDASSIDQSKIVSDAEKASGVEVMVSIGTDTQEIALRGSDAAPFYSGGQMQSSTNSNDVCSNGFAINKLNTTFTTTARHCRSASYQAYNTVVAYGGTQAYTSDGGARVLYKTGSGNMFRGAWNSNVSATKVGSLRDVGLNSVVCSGGANTGEHCNLKVTAMSVMITDSEGPLSTIRAVQQGSGYAAGSGDSGGPIFVVTTDGKIGAVGMAQAISGNVRWMWFYSPHHWRRGLQ